MDTSPVVNTNYRLPSEHEISAFISNNSANVFPPNKIYKFKSVNGSTVRQTHDQTYRVYIKNGKLIAWEKLSDSIFISGFIEPTLKLSGIYK